MKRSGRMKLLSILMTVVLVFGALPGTALASEPEEEPDELEEASETESEEQAADNAEEVPETEEPVEDDVAEEETADQEDPGITVLSEMEEEDEDEIMPLATVSTYYIDENGEEQTVEATEVTSSDAEWTDGWYVVNGNVTNSTRINVDGEVYLILSDDCTLTASRGIKLSGGNYLTIYMQEKGNGTLNATGQSSNSGIGGNSYNSGGSLTVNGGIINAQGASGGAGIGCGNNGEIDWIYNYNGGTVTINGGIVTATGGSQAAGIGGGHYCNGAYVTINGGTVYAEGGNKGIGEGYNGGSRTFITGTEGNAFIIASSIGDTSHQSEWSGVIFNGTEGKVYGNPTLKYDAEIPSDYKLRIPEGTSLTVGNGTALTNNGTIYQDYGGIFTNSGTYTGTTYYGIDGDVEPIGATTYSDYDYALKGTSISGEYVRDGSTLISYEGVTQSGQELSIDNLGFTMPEEPVKLTTTDFSRTLTYSAEGNNIEGTIPESVTKYKHDESGDDFWNITVEGDGLINNGVDLSGWSTKANGSQEYFVGDTLMLDTNITLYACWRGTSLTKDNETYTYYPTVQDAVDASGSGYGLVKMETDSQENVSIASGQEITLDLNSYTLSATGSGSTVITNKGTFTLTDGTAYMDEEGNYVTGKVTGGYYGIYNNGSSSSLTVESGTITGNSSAGIYNNGSTTMNNGAITDNYYHGVFNYNGTFTMNNGIIADNHATGSNNDTRGGGVFIQSFGTFYMNGGLITGNEAASYGGGIYNDSVGTLVMIGGTITGNTANCGGGVYWYGYGSDKNYMSNDAAIYGNSATSYAADIYASADSSWNVTLIPAADMAAGDYTATGWYEDGSNARYVDTDDPTEITELNITSRTSIIAAYGYALNYDTNGSEGEIEGSVTDIPKDQNTITITDEEPSAPGSSCNFASWNTKSDGSGTIYKAGDEIELEEKTTLYAQYGEHELVKTDAVLATLDQAGNTAYWTCSICGKYFSDEDGTEEIEEGSWIVPAMGSVTATGYSGTYDGEGHAISVTVNLNTDEGVTEDGLAITYSTDENGDFTVENPSYANAGTYTVYYKISKENYKDVTGSAEVIISEKTLTSSMFTVNTDSVTYTGSEITKSISGSDPAAGNEPLVLDEDYTVSYENNVNAGEATITITGKENYTGELSYTFDITKADQVISYENTELHHLENAHSFTNELTETVVSTDEDSQITYSSSDESIAIVDLDTGEVNIDGTGTVTITATAAETANFNGATASYTLEIVKPEETVSEDVDKVYDGGDIYLYASVEHENEGDAEGLTYTYYWYRNDELISSTTTAVLRLSGDDVSVQADTEYYCIIVMEDEYFTDYIYQSLTVTITAKEIDEDMFEVDTEKETYTGSEITKAITGYDKEADAALNEGVDYTVSYENNTDAGTATITIEGAGNYTGTLTYTFEINSKEITENLFTVNTSEVTYTGTAITKTITGYDEEAGKALAEGEDYTVDYSNNTNAGTATITITGIGNYDGELTYTFVINKAVYDMSGIGFADATYTYNGEEQSVEITGDLPDGVTVSYTDNTRVIAGSQTATATFTGDPDNYEVIPDMTAELTILDATFGDMAITATGYSGTYDGEGHTITVEFSGNAEGAKVTYSTQEGGEYSDENPAFTDVGTYTVYYKVSKENYEDVTGSLTVKITEQTLTTDLFDVDTDAKTYTGEPITTLIDSALVVGTDYTVSYEDNTDVGTATITITGTGNYTGTVIYTFEIDPKEATKDMFTVNTEDATYNGAEQTKDISGYDAETGSDLTEGEDYKVTYSDNVNAGTATITIKGTGNYTGTVTYTFEIDPKEATDEMFTVDTDDETYTGIAFTKDITGYDPELEAELTEGRDYTVTYSDNTDAGTATITIKGTGNYTGTLTYTFEIDPKEIIDEMFTVNTDDETYTGSAISKSVIGINPETGAELQEGVDYIVTYENNTDVGTATITITGIGNYTGTLTYTFEIVEEVKGIEPGPVTENPDNGGTGGTKTGDTNNILLWLVLLVVAAAIVVAVAVSRRRMRR